MKIARIAYLNTDPFFFDWDKSIFPVTTGSPRECAQAAGAGEISAGPLPVVEGWKMESQFEPLGHFGIAVKNSCPSVLVLSKVPFSQLNQMTVSVTPDSSTSVALCDVLIQKKYAHQVYFQRGFKATDEARLMIGDAALKIWHKPDPIHWPFVTDLAAEWGAWQKRPFVFARWIIRKDVPFHIKSLLSRQILTSLNRAQTSLASLALRAQPKLSLPNGVLESYLKGFIYELDQEELEGLSQFQHLFMDIQSQQFSARA